MNDFFAENSQLIVARLLANQTCFDEVPAAETKEQEMPVVVETVMNGETPIMLSPRPSVVRLPPAPPRVSPQPRFQKPQDLLTQPLRTSPQVQFQESRSPSVNFQPSREVGVQPSWVGRSTSPLPPPASYEFHPPAESEWIRLRWIIVLVCALAALSCVALIFL